jgi:predicted DNA-binding transcriptional regulator AlpA
MAVKLVNIQDIAEQCNVSVATVRYWVSTKYTPPHVRLGRRLVWTQESIDNWLEQKFEAAAAAREDVIPDGQLVLEVDSPRKAKRTAGGADARMAV